VTSADSKPVPGEWLYSYCYCNVTLGENDWKYYGYQCSLCGNKNLRFIHVLKHKDSRKEIEVGIECAVHLLFPEEKDFPRLAENETARKERWRRRYQTYGICRTTVDDLQNRGKV
jgi:hypothetical protein